MSGWLHRWNGTDASGRYAAEHSVDLQDTADVITYQVDGVTKLSIDVFEFERLCAELAKFDYIEWPSNKGESDE